MAIGLSSTRKIIWSEDYTARAAIPEGAVCVFNAAGEAVLPTGAGAGGTRACGVSISAGTTYNDGSQQVSVCILGATGVLLVAGATVAVGDELVIANAQGHVRTRVAGDVAGTVIGTSLVGKTGGANAEFINARINLHEIAGF